MTGTNFIETLNIVNNGWNWRGDDFRIWTYTRWRSKGIDTTATKRITKSIKTIFL